MTTTTETHAWPLGDMETALGEIEMSIRMVGHLALSPNEVEQDEWLAVENRLLELHCELESLWKAAWDKNLREREAHEAELAAAKARTAPGSKAEVERVASLWGLLAGAAQVIQERAAEAMPEGARLAGGDAVKLRHAVAPVDAGLPPAESGSAAA